MKRYEAQFWLYSGKDSETLHKVIFWPLWTANIKSAEKIAKLESKALLKIHTFAKTAKYKVRPAERKQ